MRKFMIGLSLLLTAVSLQAQSVSGIRVDAGYTPVLVYLNGTPMNSPSTSCFIANLKAGNYMLEVYASQPAYRPGSRTLKGEKLYSRRIRFDGRGVENVNVGNVGGHPGGPSYGVHPPIMTDAPCARVMDDRLFGQFFERVKKESFDRTRLDMIKTSLANSDFTSAQCLRLVNLFSFDSKKMEVMKMMYPCIVDKEAFFKVVDGLSFSSHKEEINEYIRAYGKH